MVRSLPALKKSVSLVCFALQGQHSRVSSCYMFEANLNAINIIEGEVIEWIKEYLSTLSCLIVPVTCKDPR